MNFLEQLKNLANKGKEAEENPPASEGEERPEPAPARPRKRRKQNLNPLDPKNLPALIPVAIGAIGAMVFGLYLLIQSVFFAPPPIPTDTPPPLVTPGPATDSVAVQGGTDSVAATESVVVPQDPNSPVTAVATYYPPPRPISLPQAGASASLPQALPNPAMQLPQTLTPIPRLDVVIIPERPNEPIRLASTAEELGQTDLIFWQMVPARDIRVRVHERQRLSNTGEAVVLVEFEDDPSAMAGKVTRKRPDNSIESYVLTARDTAWIPEAATLRGAQQLNAISPASVARAEAILVNWEGLVRRAAEAAAILASSSAQTAPARPPSQP